MLGAARGPRPWRHIGRPAGVGLHGGSDREVQDAAGPGSIPAVGRRVRGRRPVAGVVRHGHRVAVSGAHGEPARAVADPCTGPAIAVTFTQHRRDPRHRLTARGRARSVDDDGPVRPHPGPDEHGRRGVPDRLHRRAGSGAAGHHDRGHRSRSRGSTCGERRVRPARARPISSIPRSSWAGRPMDGSASPLTGDWPRSPRPGLFPSPRPPGPTLVYPLSPRSSGR